MQVGEIRKPRAVTIDHHVLRFKAMGKVFIYRSTSNIFISAKEAAVDREGEGVSAAAGPSGT